MHQLRVQNTNSICNNLIYRLSSSVSTIYVVVNEEFNYKFEILYMCRDYIEENCMVEMSVWYAKSTRLFLGCRYIVVIKIETYHIILKYKLIAKEDLQQVCKIPAKIQKFINSPELVPCGRGHIITAWLFELIVVLHEWLLFAWRSITCHYSIRSDSIPGAVLQTALWLWSRDQNGNEMRAGSHPAMLSRLQFWIWFRASKVYVKFGLKPTHM